MKDVLITKAIEEQRILEVKLNELSEEVNKAISRFENETSLRVSSLKEDLNGYWVTEIDFS